MDGRVDNRDELKQLLKRQSVRFVSDTDAEIVLRSYQCGGEESPAKILGDFAFALWDGPWHQLFCARDFASVQPFYYYYDGRTFLCASEPQQIFVDPVVSREPDELVIGVYLTGMLLDPATTLYSALRKLEGGCSITVRPEKIDRCRYFDIDPNKVIRYRTDAEYAEHFAALFKDTVRCRLRSANGVAAELSGGLDSSLVVGSIESLRSAIPPFETFSIKFDDPASR
jgi:asparagine synthase (glutamine-hydrolysing)